LAAHWATCSTACGTGFVVDMIDFYVGDWHFATFNLADTAICVGAALIVLEGFLPSKAKKQ